MEVLFCFEIFFKRHKIDKLVIETCFFVLIFFLGGGVCVVVFFIHDQLFVYS